MKNLMILTLVGATTLASCATIVSKSDWPVSIQSTPSGVPFTVTNKAGQVISSGKTPQTLTLKSGAGYFSSERYTIQYNHNGRITTREVSADINGWYFGNIIFAGLIGFLIVDPLTGAMYKMPETVSQSFETVGDAANGPQLYIVSIDQLTLAQRQQLVPLN